MRLNESQKRSLDLVASWLGVPTAWLYNLIRFETANTFNPKIRNLNSSARGLIQFIDSTARDLGFSSAEDLVNRFPTFESQMEGPVYIYLSRFKPFSTRQSLYMSVFYPRYRFVSPYKKFPENVQRANPGIVTVSDYVSKVDGKGDALKHVFFLGIGLVLINKGVISKWLKKVTPKKTK